MSNRVTSIIKLPAILENDSVNNIHRPNCWTKLYPTSDKNELSQNREGNLKTVSRFNNFYSNIHNFTNLRL